jgi:very-long-chain enoyl-CoA reductase
MASVAVHLAGKPPSHVHPKIFPLSVELDKYTEPTVKDVKAVIAQKFQTFPASRQKITLKGDKVALSDDTLVSSIKGELAVKDLGPQISWRGVYIIEYLGPIFIHALLYHFPTIFYGQHVEHSSLQTFLYIFVVLHFLKREYETIFVHRFSHGTMPFFNVYKNCGHYWGLGGLLLAFDLYRPGFASVSKTPEYLRTCAVILAFAEVSNLNTHLKLRSLRPAGTTTRAIPYGYGFSFPGISCPNYFFESMGWLTVSIMTNSIASWIFFFVGTGQMLIWASKKHRAYKKEFGTQYPKRAAMIPFIF